MQGLRIDDDGESEEFGKLIAAAFGLDRTWTALAACREYSISNNLTMTPWHVARDYKKDGVTGRELIKAALMICHNCPVQYDCARYAVQGLMQAGTFAMQIGDLMWLQGQDDGLDLIQEAEDLGVPVQIVVGVERHDRQAAR